MTRHIDIPCEYKIEDVLHFPCHRHTDFDLMVLVTRPCRGHAILYFEMTGMCIHDCHSNICLQSTLQFAEDILDEKWSHCRRRRGHERHHHQEDCEQHRW